ncbi:MAG: DUF2231 domain-containing protein [Chloroflexi bacterium]|nr:DUF2231 domain-containing protein [Chloroflexota bacterium]
MQHHIGLPLHAFTAAFPMALVITALGAELTHWRTRNPFWARFSSVILAIGACGAVLAVATGLFESIWIAHPLAMASPVMISHMLSGFILTAVVLWQVFLRARQPNKARCSAALHLMLIGLALLGLNVWLGGELVYRYNVGT